MGQGAALRPFAPDAMRDAAVIAWGVRLLRSGTSPSGARDLLALYRDIDVRDILPAIRVPTLVLHRGGDLIATAAQGRYIAARIPDARYVELPGSDHVPVLGDVDPLLDEIEEAVTGERHRSQPDRVLATVLFTDICRSTERAAELGDRRWRDLLVEHDAMVRREVERHRGRLIKPIGDGTLATFDGPARAIDAALAIRDAVGALGLQVRAGLHTGECELIGQDVGGFAVHIGAECHRHRGARRIRVWLHGHGLGGGVGAALRRARDAGAEGCAWPLAAVRGRRRAVEATGSAASGVLTEGASASTPARGGAITPDRRSRRALMPLSRSTPGHALEPARASAASSASRRPWPPDCVIARPIPAASSTT